MWPEHISKEKLLSNIIMHENNQAIEKLEQLKGNIFYEISDIVHHVIWYKNSEVAGYVIDNFKVPFMPRCIKDILLVESEELLHVFAQSKEYDVPQMALLQCVKDNNEKMFSKVCALNGDLTHPEIWLHAVTHSNETMLNAIVRAGFKLEVSSLRNIIFSSATQAIKNRIIKNILDDRPELLAESLINSSMENKTHHVSYQLLKRWDKAHPDYDWSQSKWLIKACLYNDNKSTQWLLKKQVNIHQEDNQAIYHAAQNYNPKLCELLLSYGAQIPDRTYKNLGNSFASWLMACPKYLHLSKKLEKNLPVQDNPVDTINKIKI